MMYLHDSLCFSSFVGSFLIYNHQHDTLVGIDEEITFLKLFSLIDLLGVLVVDGVVPSLANVDCRKLFIKGGATVGGFGLALFIDDG